MKPQMQQAVFDCMLKTHLLALNHIVIFHSMQENFVYANRRIKKFAWKSRDFYSSEFSLGTFSCDIKVNPVIS